MRFARITVNSDQMGGVPCIRGLRIPVAAVVGMVADEMTKAERHFSLDATARAPLTQPSADLSPGGEVVKKKGPWRTDLTSRRSEPVNLAPFGERSAEGRVRGPTPAEPGFAPANQGGVQREGSNKRIVEGEEFLL